MSILVKDMNEQMEPKFSIMIPALSFSHCFNLRRAFFCVDLVAVRPMGISGLRLGGGWIGFGTIFCGVRIFWSFGHFLDFFFFICCGFSAILMTRRVTLLPYLSFRDLVCRDAEIPLWFMLNENKDEVVPPGVFLLSRTKDLARWEMKGDWQSLFIL